MSKIPQQIKSIPRAFSQFAATVNGLILWAVKVEKMEARDGLKFDASDQKLVLSFPAITDLRADIAAATLRTFFVTGSGANVKVSAGAINSVIYAGGTINEAADGDKIYIDATISGTTVTAVTVSKAASVPADDTEHLYTLLATVAVASSIATPTPVAWNYSQLQICAGQGLWGGFGA